MQYRETFKRLKATFLLLGALLVTACGGGGGGGDNGFTPGNGDNSLPVVYFVVVELSDADGTRITEVPIGTLADIVVTVTEGKRIEDALPVKDAIALASSDVGAVLPEGGSALTDASGRAVLQLDPGTIPVAGTIRVQVRDREEEGELNFQVVPSELRIGSFVEGEFVEGTLDIMTTNLPYGGSTPVKFAIVDPDGDLADIPQTVDVAVSCSRSTPLPLPTPGQLAVPAGEGEFLYEADTCIGGDVIDVALALAPDTSASGSVFVANPGVGSISFVAATPEIVAIRGSGTATRPDVSEVVFKVNNVLDEAAAEVPVRFVLSNESGGLTLSEFDVITDVAGLAKTTLEAGTLPASVEVVATTTIDDMVMSAVSTTLSVSGGLPDQNSFSVSQSTFSVGGGDFDGEKVSFNISMADKLNNPVPDGSIVNLTTRFGKIPVNCATAGGQGTCSVEWQSSNPRLPFTGTEFLTTIQNTACPVFLPAPSFGPCPLSLGPVSLVNAVLVTARGEESFNDSNGNGVFDFGELFSDLAEPFHDHNFDGILNPVETPCDPDIDGPECASGVEETYVDTNQNGRWDEGNGMYDGSLCPDDGVGVYCTRDRVDVRANLPLIVSNHSQFFSLTTTSGTLVQPGAELRAGQGYVVHVADFYNKMPPAGSTVEVSATGCTLLNSSAGEVPNALLPGAFTTTFVLDEDTANAESILGFVTLTVKTVGEGATETSAQWPCRDFANIPITPPDPVALYQITIDPPAPSPTISGQSVIQVRVSQGSTPVSGIPVDGLTLVGNLQSDSVTTESGVASFVYLGTAPGGDTFTATVEDPNVDSVSNSISFNVQPDEFFVGFIQAGVANDSIIGLIPTVVAASELPRNVTVIADVFDRGGVRATNSVFSVDFLVQCALGSYDATVSANTANGTATATIPIPPACATPADIKARIENPAILNQNPPPGALLTIQ